MKEWKVSHFKKKINIFINIQRMQAYGLALTHFHKIWLSMQKVWIPPNLTITKTHFTLATLLTTGTPLFVVNKQQVHINSLDKNIPQNRSFTVPSIDFPIDQLLF